MADAFADLLAVMDRLRRECAWTRQQTHESLREYVLEEAHEVVEAIDGVTGGGDPAQLRDELGDLLMQVVFHARIAQESGPWDIDDVVRAITDKLVRRNPHVFAPTAEANARTMTPQQVDAQWQRLKAQEKATAREQAGNPG